ncbi:MAG: ABC transporter permease [Bacilli bacterium]|jgi:spermidine/putrescine transport system permease protein|nr:ABC transporter permease [Acholeplasmataceae bacterium]
MKKFGKFAIPYLVWMGILVVIPLAIMVGLAFLKTDGVSLKGAQFTFENFSRLFDHAIIVGLSNSLKFSIITTIACLLLGYPVAYIISKANIKNRFLVMAILILPMWSNMLLRTTALRNIFSPNNIITDLLGIEGINIIGTELAVILGMISTYLPFMILPIYTVLEKIEPSLLEASNDLGANNFRTFWKVVFPISLKGVASGVILVLLPSATGFAIPRILGEGNYVLIGSIIENSFDNMNYNFGSLLSLIIIIIIMGALLIISKIDKEGETLL